MSRLPHRILRQMVDLQCFGRTDGLELRRRLERLCTDQLTRAVDQLLDSWGVPEHELVAIDRLQVELPAVSDDRLESELVPGIVAALRSELEARIGPAGQLRRDVARPLQRSVFAELLHFLERGCLPWSASGDRQWSTTAAAALMEIHPEDWSRLWEHLASAGARQRLARHFPIETARWILPRLWSGAEPRQILIDLEGVLALAPDGIPRARLRERWMRLLLDAAIEPTDGDWRDLCRALWREGMLHRLALPPAGFDGILNSTALRVTLAEIFADAPPRPFTSEEPDPSNQRARLAAAEAGAPGTLPASGGRASVRSGVSPPGGPADDSVPAPVVKPVGRDDVGSIYIRNGGLVFLATYLPAFFQRLELSDAERVRDIPTALGLLHYLGFRSEECAEWDLVLNKILCGIPLEESVETPPSLSDAQKSEAERLLEAVIANWPAVGHTSPDAIRGTFLQREGMLRWTGHDWHLRLNRTGFDVLVDRLPWTYSMIRLPWMSWMLRTDWATEIG